VVAVALAVKRVNTAVVAVALAEFSLELSASHQEL
jgi:hypothetical protein